MKTMGFIIGKKENERRRALLPPDLADIKHVNQLHFETRYGDILGYTDADYRKMGANVVDRQTAYDQNIVCCPKPPGPEEYKFFKDGQILLGWIHAVQGRKITDFLLAKKMTAIAWEEMFENGRHVFWRNNELAGEAGVLHAFLYYGKPPYECRAAILGRGNTARGAMRILEKMGSNITVYDRASISNLINELGLYDVIINCVLWDVFRKDRLIYHSDLKNMKKGAMIIDISCNDGLEIETTHATPINDPIYYVDGILHYAVDHTATIFWKTASESISKEVKRYIDDLVQATKNEVLDRARIIRNGKIIDGNIVKFQGR